MTNILPGSSGWPSILLAGAGRAAATDPADRAEWPALRRVVRDLGSTGTIAQISASGLRGRGGGGYPTGEKWRACATTEAPRRHVVANAYAADPSSRTDLALLEIDAHSVLEGLAIAAFSVGAEETVVAVRADATAAIAALELTIAEATAAGALGPDVFGSGHRIDVSIRPVQGAYMLGEETVLLRALEGKRGQPEQRPPHPAQRGLFGMPTVVQNVQTLAAIPWIVVNGAEAFAATGARGTTGTILVSLRGPGGEGVAEVPLGTPLREIVALAGALPPGRSVKAVLVGGPSGGILPAELLDTPYDFDSLRAAGAHLGSGSVVVADDRACIVDLARLVTRFCADEACGKTIPCRIGLRRLSEIADRIATGVPLPTDPTLLADLAADVVGSALCDHERLATLPLMSGMRYFRSELDEHILRSSCPAGVCRPIAVGAGATH